MYNTNKQGWYRSLTETLHLTDHKYMPLIDAAVKFNNNEASTHLSLLVSSQLEVLATFCGDLLAVLAACALHSQHNLLGCLGLDKHNLS